MTQRPRRADDLAADLRADMAEAEQSRPTPTPPPAERPPPAPEPAGPPAPEPPPAAPAGPSPSRLRIGGSVLALSFETSLQLWPPTWALPGLRLRPTGLVVTAGPIRVDLGVRRDRPPIT